MMNINSKHYDTFLSCLANQPESQKPIGKKPRDWYKSVTGDVSESLLGERLCRKTLRDFCADKNNSDEECIASVMSWGGQRVGHGRMIFDAKNDQYRPIDAIAPIVASMRAGKETRTSAYEKFHQLRLDKKLKGMGIAYYTKLIYFCDPKHDGYILDQWLAKSVNLLSTNPLVEITKYGYVTDKNDAQRYGQFCEVIDHIADATGNNKTPDQIETAMFSHGGRKKGDWRRYVISSLT